MLRYTQASIYDTRYIRVNGQVGGEYSIAGNVELLEDPNFDLPPARAFRMNNTIRSWGPMERTVPYPDDTVNVYKGDPLNLEIDQFYSLDNRRLATYIKAGRTDIPVEWVDPDTIMVNRFEFSTQNKGIDIEMLQWQK